MSKGKGRGRGRGAPNDPARRERASRSGVQGVVQEAATAEVLEAGAAADSAPGKLPALGKEELPRLVERFEHLGFPFPRGIDKFKPEDARLAFNAHLEKWGLSKRDTPHARGPIQPRVYVSRPVCYTGPLLVTERFYFSAFRSAHDDRLSKAKESRRRLEPSRHCLRLSARAVCR